MHHHQQSRGLPLVTLALVTVAFAPGALAAAETKSARKPAPLELEKTASPEPWARYGSWPKDDWGKFSTMAKDATPPLGGFQKVHGPIEDGDVEKGKKLAFDRGRGGGCLACHIIPGGSLPGNVGPDLSTIGTQGRTDWYLYNYIYDARAFNPQTMMPPWGAHGLYKPEEIRDIVAFLKTLKKPAEFKGKGENPNQRQRETPLYNPKDPFENPGLTERDKGKALYAKKGPAGKSCADCHAKPEQAFRGWAARMPYYEPRLKRPLNSEEFITRHARATTGDDWRMQTEQNDALSIYLRNLGAGVPISIQFRTADEKAAAAKGKAYMARKIGTLHFMCNDCHGQAENKWIRGQFLTGSKNQVGHHPYYRTSQGEIWTIRKRFQWCGVATRTNELPPDAPEYAFLEYYLTSLSNGKKVETPSMGH